MTPLDQSNRERILATSSHLLVMGGPGSGKTTIALDKALQCIEVGLLPGQMVLFLSFSRAAVARLAQAATRQIPSGRRQQLQLQTFHSFFWEWLKTHGYLLGAPRPLRIMLPHDERVISGGVKPKNVVAWNAWKDRREKLFTETGQIAFDLFAPKACALLEKSLHIKELISDLYPVIIVDEAQDTGSDAWKFISMLKQACQIICLADLEQQIFDHLPGIGPERIAAIKSELSPIEVDLGQVNNRSPNTEIAIFARDVLDDTPRGNRYLGVGRVGYDPRSYDLLAILRKSIAMTFAGVRRLHAHSPESIAILVTSGREVAAITSALSKGPKVVPHHVLFDEALAILSSRFAAFLLEPKSSDKLDHHMVQGLELLANIEKARGTDTGAKAHARLLGWADKVRNGKQPKTNTVSGLLDLMTRLASLSWTGDPSKDWLTAKHLIRASSAPDVSRIANDLDYLVAFNRGRRIIGNLSQLWSELGCYENARIALDTALAQDALLSGVDDPGGIHIMTIHRSKGKQFDGVIVLRRSTFDGKSWRSSFTWKNDFFPYTRSRKILRVAITRAKKHVFIVEPNFPTCPILRGHNL